MALTKSIREFIQRQSLMGLFLIALTPRLIWWIVVWLMTGDFTLFDSGQFILIADNLLQHGEFSRSTSSPFFPDIARTPGYPLFLAIFKSFGLSLKAVSFFQMLLGALIPVMIFRLSKKLKFDNGWIGFVLLCLSPSLILFVPILLSDGLFLLLFAIAIILLLKEKSWRNLILLGIVLGVMAITRPIGQFLPFLIIPYLLVQRVSWSRVLVFFFATAMLPALWSARNYHHFETFRLSSMSTNNLLMYNATAARASAEGRPFSEVQYEVALKAQESADWEDPMATKKYLDYCKEEAFTIFQEHSLPLVKNTFQSLFFYHLKPPRSYFDKALGIGYQYDPILGFAESGDALLFGKLKDVSVTSLVLASIQFIINLILLVLGVKGFFRLRKVNPSLAWLLAGMICYFWFLSVFTMTDSRFQLPCLLVFGLLASGRLKKK